MATKTRKTRKPLTEAEQAERDARREAFRAEATEKLDGAVQALLSEDGFRAWLDARALFHNYSMNNTLLILAQRPDATRVAGASTWRKLDRMINKGERAMRVFAPKTWAVSCAKDAPGAFWNERRNEYTRKITVFDLVPVFDVAQTNGADLPEPPKPQPLTGDSHAHLLPRLEALATDLGYTVTYDDDLTGCGGYCDAQAKSIVVGPGEPNARVRVLTHELAHALGITYQTHTRAQAELIVESVTYVVLRGAGLDTAGVSVTYVAGWSADEASGIAAFAADLDAVARRIEKAIEDPADEPVAA